MQDKPSGINYEIAHQTMGRIRIRIPKIKQSSVYVNQLEKLIAAHPGITDVRINPPAISLVVNYKPKVISDEAIAPLLHNYIQQAGGIDPATVPFPDPPKAETETPLETETETPLETETETSGNSETPNPNLAEEAPQTQGESEKISPSTASEGLAEDAVISEVSTSASQSSEVTITTIESKEESPEEVEQEAETKSILRLNQKTLAKRLQISSNSLRQARSQPNFASWSSAKDPEGKAWKYTTESGFYEEILDE